MGDLAIRKELLVQRLQDVSIPPFEGKPPKRKKIQTISSVTDTIVPTLSKTSDTHWDFLLKEMQWLAADFTAERQRHSVARRKIAGAVAAWKRGAAAREAKRYDAAVAAQRKTAARIQRAVTQWWVQLDRVIAYQQRCVYEEGQRNAMNQQLVRLVQQTEKYTSQQQQQQQQQRTRSVTDDEDNTDDLETILQRNERTSIAPRNRRAPQDYATLDQQMKNDTADDSDAGSIVLYGDSDGSDDSSYHASVGSDDESTMRRAEEEEMKERGEESFVADPEELRLLHEEANTPINQLMDEVGNRPTVTFAAPLQSEDETLGSGSSSVDGSEDFVANEADMIDDETTMEEEERLPQEMSRKQEIEILEAENEMSVDELRRKYYSTEVEEMQVEEESEDARMDDDNDDAATGSDQDSHNDHDSTVNSEMDVDEQSDEYEPDETAVDDETTMEAEERLGRDMSYADEIALLNEENEMSVEELRAKYTGDGQSVGSESSTNQEPTAGAFAALQVESIGDDENDGDFRPDETERDDETTIEAEERLGREMTPEEELALLEADSKVSIDEIRKLYQAETVDDERLSDEDGVVVRTSSRRRRKINNDERGQRRRKRRKLSTNDDPALRQAGDPEDMYRKSLVSRPFLIPSWVKLREYQQHGLSWLVSLQSRRLNGILADEMGLGKTLQTISLLGYLAAYKGIWGPHLVVVPTSVILNWETELKRFCPGLKVLCYYGTAKRRKELRTGWTKSNFYHVVITSYQLAVQDSFAFKRKKWYYLILDEAQHIKNFQSQRWQTLITFNTQRRLLLTGTPLQNSLMELWSLLHFLMPYIFSSRKEFSYWFANPMTNMIEGKSNKNDDVVNRLHGIIRPFVLRRLKKDVETQLPGKFEHIVKCQLSRRQALRKGGNFMGMMTVLMQLRKVCNHPDLFEPRSVVTPFVLDPIRLRLPRCILNTESASMIDRISPSFVHRLWCGSHGTASVEFATRHDVVESTELLQLEASDGEVEGFEFQAESTADGVHPSIVMLAQGNCRSKSRRSHETARFLREINRERCRSRPFSYNQRLLDIATLEEPVLLQQSPDILATPSQLLSARKNQLERAAADASLVKWFVFAVPKAGAPEPVIDGFAQSVQLESSTRERLSLAYQESIKPFRDSRARLSSFFPDKRLVQFDAGKLQTLSKLLRERKAGDHKVLIFTQMSKMLDILEVFLNLNGHSYLRLDGGTSVDRRQRLMDRFNNDPKIFAFILSTRSGGVGVNLTGADSVIFYDSDWNPAQDAQAQDRAHRIGQTREVHIFRLVTESSIEENILLKARQKRNLDIVVMDKGNFNASKSTELVGAGDQPDVVKDVYTKGGILEILGVAEEEAVGDSKEKADTTDLTTEQIENTMASLEDVDDAKALRGVRKEAADELKEFDESIEYKKDSDAEEELEQTPAAEGKSKSDKEEEKELERQIAAWQDKVGLDAETIKSSLSPIEKYGLKLHEDVDPYHSQYFVMEEQRKLDEEEKQQQQIDIDEIEKQKASEEKKAFEDGDLLCTFAEPQDLLRQRNLYLREKARLAGQKRRRQLTGENWEQKNEGNNGFTYWYNVDTGEAVWDKPKVLLEMDAYGKAYQEGWSSIPQQLLVYAMGFLLPFPDRTRCSSVCTAWHKASSSPVFVRHVYPVEQGAYTIESEKMEPNHFRTIADALNNSFPGDTIELADGHYWQSTKLDVNMPVRIIGDEHNPSNVVIELRGSISWKLFGGYIEGVTFRRPKIASENAGLGPMLTVVNAKLNMFRVKLDNGDSDTDTALVTGSSSNGTWSNVKISNGKNGLRVGEQAQLCFNEGSISDYLGSAIICSGQAKLEVDTCYVKSDGGDGVHVLEESRIRLRDVTILTGKRPPISMETGCTVESEACQCADTENPLPEGFSLLVHESQ